MASLVLIHIADTDLLAAVVHHACHLLIAVAFPVLHHLVLTYEFLDLLVEVLVLSVH